MGSWRLPTEIPYNGDYDVGTPGIPTKG